MASILTNTNSQVALSTLRGINKNISDITSEISTGKKVASAADNAAIWAVSTVIESDVKGFEKISESLNLGKSTTGVARSAAEEVTGLLQEVKGLVVAAQEDNVDRSKIQTDIGNLRDQINSIVDAAQFNGLNLVKGTENVNVLASLDRAADGEVTASNITVARQNLEVSETGANTTVSATRFDGTTTGDIDGSATGTLDLNGLTADNFQVGDTLTLELTTGTAGTASDAGDTLEITLSEDDLTATDFGDQVKNRFENASASSPDFANTTFSSGGTGLLSVANGDTTGNDSVVTLTGTGANTKEYSGATASAASITSGASTLDFRTATTGVNLSSGNTASVTLDGNTFTYAVQAGDTDVEVSAGLTALVQGGIDDGTLTGLSVADGEDGQLTVTETLGNAVTVDVDTNTGGLAALDGINVSTANGAENALSDIEALIQTGIDAAAAFGSAESRIEIQNEFVTNLRDSLNAGIGALRDSDLEQASARLQSLQVQQQLGIQALGIANSQPQNILSLFR